MPRRVDHEERRREIAEALCRIAARGGLAAATFREVAAEAGVSVRLVQYYFGTKAELLHAANRYVAARAGARLTKRLARTKDREPREVVRALVREFLPTTEERRETMLLFFAFYSAQMTDPSLARGEGRNPPQGLATIVAHQIRRAQEAGEVRSDLAVDAEAMLLTVAVPSIVSGPLVGYTTLREASKLLDHAVDRIFEWDGTQPGRTTV
jgi:AcrR family transcriptional regulator